MIHRIIIFYFCLLFHQAELEPVVAQTDEEYQGFGYDKGLDCRSRLTEGSKHIQRLCDPRKQRTLATDRTQCLFMINNISVLLQIYFPSEIFPSSPASCDRASRLTSAGFPGCSFQWKARIPDEYVCVGFGPRHCPRGDSLYEYEEIQADWACCDQWWRLENNLRKCEEIVDSFNETLGECGAFLTSEQPEPSYFRSEGYLDILYEAYGIWQSADVLIDYLRDLAKIDEYSFECYRRPPPPTPVFKALPRPPLRGPTGSSPG